MMEKTVFLVGSAGCYLRLVHFNVGRDGGQSRHLNGLGKLAFELFQCLVQALDKDVNFFLRSRSKEEEKRKEGDEIFKFNLGDAPEKK